MSTKAFTEALAQKLFCFSRLKARRLSAASGKRLFSLWPGKMRSVFEASGEQWQESRPSQLIDFLECAWLTPPLALPQAGSFRGWISNLNVRNGCQCQ